VVKQLGISSGVGGNKFAPEAAITRQEMFTLLYNAIKTIDKLPGADAGQTLSGFTDSGSIAAWPQEAMTALGQAGMISGSYDRLDPIGHSTRAQMAQVLYNLLNK
jgi:hypothetical protein